ncbi:hypothetical protein H5410_009602 [Solanum commersonii]|uniref:Protein farnesyltransferase subunit beta n=1 Tax=Solanum commersonii TaxID=4109 RepID=A0A9J6AIG3_SOLCO|nr:hypothetical protein H5410_009602 [Solanum commersonii]
MESRKVTKTLEDQWVVERRVREIYDYFYSISPNSLSDLIELERDKHFDYLSQGLRKLGPSFSVLDASRPWLCYWILHSIALLGESIDAKLENDATDFLTRCQMPHLATTYAAVNSLITLGKPEALSSINREKLYTFLLRMKDASGGFRMHDGGEVDVRACYTAISVANILNIVDDELIHGVGNYILSCQTYEGGIAGEPGSEAHGGYTFCGLAAMILINEVNRLDLPGLIDWVVFRQGIEGGFQGRTNKLVDGCYSFWQGAVVFLIQRLNLVVHEQLGLSNDLSTESADDSSESELSDEEEHLEGTSSHVQETFPLGQEGAGQDNASDSPKIADTGYEFINRPIAMRPLFDSMYLQQYVLLCSQIEVGGFRDKPGKGRDYYHTCYCLSGLSIAQYSWTDEADSPPLPRDVFGPYSKCLLEQVHPLFNVELDRYYEARKYFSG